MLWPEATVAPQPRLEPKMRSTLTKSPWCRKDPRFCHTLAVWEPLFGDAVRFCVFREPSRTANSMVKVAAQQQVSLSFDGALEIWASCYLRVLRQHRHRGEWVFVHYDQVLDGTGIPHIEDAVGAKVDRNVADSALRRTPAGGHRPSTRSTRSCATSPVSVAVIEVTPAESIPVAFEGAGAGIGPLSWGQRELWYVVEEKHTWLPIGTTLPLPAGTTLDDAVTDLRFVMSRYPSMRTRLRLLPGEPEQVVAASGETVLEVFDAPEGADPAEVAEQVRKRYWHRDYDFQSEWPLRMAVIRHRGVLTHRVWVMCHLVTDGTGARVILSDLADRDGAGDTTMPPLEQARWQGSPAGQRQSEAALRYWESILRRVSPNRFPPRADLPHPRYWEGSFDSPATRMALRVICARTRMEMSSALLTLFAVALARVTGINPVVVVLVVNNRFRPGLARSVSPIIHPGLCLIDVPDCTIDQAISHTRRRALAAYKNAYYSPVKREEMIERVHRDRGGKVDLECSLNDSRLTPRDESGPAPTPEQIRAALSRSTFEWTGRQDTRPYDKLYVTVEDKPDTIALSVVTDIHHVAPEDVAAFIRDMEAIAVAAACDPATRTDVPALSA